MEAKSYKIGFIETSAKNANNIEISFQNIARTIITKLKTIEG